MAAHSCGALGGGAPFYTSRRLLGLPDTGTDVHRALQRCPPPAPDLCVGYQVAGPLNIVAMVHMTARGAFPKGLERLPTRPALWRWFADSGSVQGASVAIHRFLGSAYLI